MEVGRIAELSVEPQGGLNDVVDDELDLGEAAVRGPAVSFGRQPDDDASPLMGLGKDEFLHNRVAPQRQDGNIGPRYPLQRVHPTQPQHIAVHFSRQKCPVEMA